MSTVIRAKMFVNTVSQHRYGNHSGGEPAIQEQVKLGAVYSDKEGSANKEWAKATPSGSLELTIDNPGAHGRLKPGMFVYVDLIPCERDSP